MFLLSEKAEADSQVCYFEERVLVYLAVCVFIYIRGFEQYITKELCCPSSGSAFGI